MTEQSGAAVTPGEKNPPRGAEADHAALTDQSAADRVWQAALPKPLRVLDITLRGFQIVGMALVVMLMLLTVAHVVGRYLFEFPMLGVVEVSGLIVVTLVFFAAPYDFFIDRHIAVDVVVRRLPPRAKLTVQVFIYLITLVAVTLAFLWTVRQGNRVSGSGAQTDILRIPLYPFYFLVALGWLLSMVAIAARLARFFVEARRSRSE